MAQLEPISAKPVATLDEVARVAGVSRATVSRVVNGSPKVSPDVRRSVEKAIDRLGYVPNRAARSLVTRRSDSIALVITEPTTLLFSDPFFPRLVRGVSAALSTRDIQLVLLMPDDMDDEERTVRYLTAGHVDGVILVSLHGDDPLPEQLATRHIPSVVLGRPPRGVDIDFVDADNRDGGRRATAHLLANGRERIATIDHEVDEFEGVRATVEDLVRILAALPVATTELLCRPGRVDDTLRASSRYVEPRESECDALLHAEARQVVQATGIRLIHYGTL